MSKKVLKRPDFNFGILSHNSLLCILDKQLWNIINTILITDIFVLCEIKIWTHCSSCQITLQKFLWFTKCSSLLRKQSYTEILIWTKMSSLSIHIPCFLPYLFHLLQEIVLKMATLLKWQTFCWFSVLICLCADNHTQIFPSIFTRITEYPALEGTQKDQVQQLQIQVGKVRIEEESSISQSSKSKMESASVCSQCRCFMQWMLNITKVSSKQDVSGKTTNNDQKPSVVFKLSLCMQNE